MSYLASPEVCNPNEEKKDQVWHMRALQVVGFCQTEGLACAAEAATLLHSREQYFTSFST